MESIVSDNKNRSKTSNKTFGYFFAGIFMVLAILSFRLNYSLATISTVLIAIFFFFAATFYPSSLRTLNQLWYSFGILLGKVVNPFIMAILFFLIVTPVAVFTRKIGRDELSLKWSKKKTYWVLRRPPGPSPESFRELF